MKDWEYMMRYLQENDLPSVIPMVLPALYKYVQAGIINIPVRLSSLNLMGQNQNFTINNYCARMWKTLKRLIKFNWSS
jgi:hypothetical protein